MFYRNKIKNLEEQLKVQSELIQNIKFATKIPEANHKKGDEIWLQCITKNEKVIILDAFFYDKTFEWVYCVQYVDYANKRVENIGELQLSKIIK